MSTQYNKMKESSNTKEDFCKSCNKITTKVLEGRGAYRCRPCRVNSVKKRRKKLKSLSIAYMGGSCQNCGYLKCEGALEFHHKDSKEKDFGIAQGGYTRGWEYLKKELDKCIMLCSNCHREEHERLAIG
jgi:5-methylcytosine-specific restriction endonuclease McrA